MELQNEVGKGAFQECDQLAAVAQHVKWAGQAASLADIPRVVAEAFEVSCTAPLELPAGCCTLPSKCLSSSLPGCLRGQQGRPCKRAPCPHDNTTQAVSSTPCFTMPLLLQAAAAGRPGAAYVDVPSNILMSELPDAAAAQQAEAAVAGPLSVPRPPAPAADLAAAAALLRGAQRPLLVVGKGAAYAQAEGPLRQLVEAAGLPFLATAMGRGVVPDDRPLCVNAARSMALSQADVAVVVGARWVGAGCWACRQAEK
jgi:thiamine pyrophosphate-dependent acetolactate synthase large subunit-like protein